ncbi:MAG TPA: DUF1732 domain-containing protein, partial [Polyangia bacterium]|nr:DUF1732 domain-containing protein [Polyangia bacterium]
RIVKTTVERGSVVVLIREDRTAARGLDVARISDTYRELERVRLAVGSASPVDLATVAAFMAADATAAGGAVHGDQDLAALRGGVERAIRELVATRQGEGVALQADITQRVRRVAGLVDSIAQAAGAVPSRFARRLTERLAVLVDAPGFDQGRVAQEVAVLAERLDVSEEIVRLRAHLEQFEALTKAAGAVGRKLDFVLQEISREVNTIGSKAQDAAIASQVIECKAELEKIREQAQNIE